jgi:glutaredoxin
VNTSLTLYTRTQCPLCDDLAQELAALSVPVTKVDVDGSPELRDLYGLRVPVLVDAGGGVLAEGRVDLAALRGILGASS